MKGNFDIAGVKVIGEREIINCICLYRRPGRIKNKRAWKEIIKNINKNKGIILLGDFNVQHILWNCEEIDANGEKLLEELEDEDLFIVNYDTKSRMGGVGQKDSNIDLIFCNSKIHNMIFHHQGEHA